ncbi:hypothetical protein KO527_13870 [Pseudoalteromonas sp. C2R02]|uniref:hypothetical protein n=1 Tax=Pseudoalteromonas sp. C2R02 TaxID=2841565 RepID=UPI001C0955B4|nr:hypothetical protein [Pseudoalteromonas sp. C2R02]MBU2970436.1 hypothetical protein [Pseudoalteromonas sp. C2R02]
MEKFKGIVFIIFTFFGFGFLVMTPFLFYEVYDASDATELKAQVTYSRYQERGDSCWMEIEYTVLDTGNIVEIGNYQPGDFSYCGEKRSRVKENHKGKVTDIYITKNGIYYGSKGSYTQAVILSSLSALWYLYLFYLIRSNKKVEREEKVEN